MHAIKVQWCPYSRLCYYTTIIIQMHCTLLYSITLYYMYITVSILHYFTAFNLLNMVPLCNCVSSLSTQLLENPNHIKPTWSSAIHLWPLLKWLNARGWWPRHLLVNNLHACWCQCYCYKYWSQSLKYLFTFIITPVRKYQLTKWIL